MSAAIEALCAGDRERSPTLHGPEPELSVFDAVARGRVERLEQLVDIAQSHEVRRLRFAA